MKALLMAWVCAAVILPLAGCDTTHTQTTKTNWNGSQTTTDTTVQQNNLTGATTVDQTKTTTH